MSENSILGKVLPLLHTDPAMVLGPGDDCAVLSFGDKYLLAAVDQVICDVHYYSDTSPEAAAAKLLKRNLSDIAAMGGVPRWALLALAATPRRDEWFERYFRGLEACAREFDVAIAGGDLAQLPGEKRSELGALTILGEVKKELICRRDNAQIGDLICVTGVLGDTLASGHHLDFVPRLAEGRFLAGKWTNCMMDISDGLAADLPRLAQASNADIEIELGCLPRRNNCSPEQALSDGEDYELLFAVAPEKWPELLKQWPFETPVNRIGKVIDKKNNEGGSIYYDPPLNTAKVNGYEHFRA